MNVIISNKYQSALGILEIDVIKSVHGVFEPQEIINQFSNFFYDKMIIDITAIKNYENIKSMQKLSINIDMSKVILLLDDSPKINSPMYLSQLVSMGIYNFTSKPEIVVFLLDNPNSYKDVAKYQNLTMQQQDPVATKSGKELETGPMEQKVLGIKNVTEHAGATTLTYLMKKHLAKHYKTQAVELDANDFVYFNDSDLASINSNNLENYITNHHDKEVIVVDLNEGNEALCTDVIYLVEPGLIKLNKLIKDDIKIFNKLKGKKIILNQSVLGTKDVSDFEKESDSKVYFNMPCVDDKLSNDENVKKLLLSLGFTRFSKDDGKSTLFKMF